MAEAIFKQDGKAVGYTPAVAVSAGQVVARGDLVGVATLPIAAGVDGEIVIDGVFDINKTSALAIAVGDDVYFNDVTNEANKTAGIRALGVLTFPTIAANDESVTIGTGANQRVYTYKTTPGTTADWLAIGADAAGSRANLISAINSGRNGSAPNALVTAAEVTTTVVVTAINYGTAVNGVEATTETLAGVSNAWGATTLGTGTGGHTAGVGGANLGKCVKAAANPSALVRVKLKQ